MKTKLLELRKSKNLLQREVAFACGLTTAAYGSYEKGDREPTLKTLCKLADFFSVTVDELLGRTPQLFDDARVERPEVLELFDQLNVGEQERAIGYMESMLERRGIIVKRHHG